MAKTEERVGILYMAESDYHIALETFELSQVRLKESVTIDLFLTIRKKCGGHEGRSKKFIDHIAGCMYIISENDTFMVRDSIFLNFISSLPTIIGDAVIQNPDGIKVKFLTSAVKRGRNRWARNIELVDKKRILKWAKECPLYSDPIIPLE
jgi:hypothetical protein